MLNISAQTTIDRTDTNLWQDFTYDMGNVFSGVGYAYSRPLHWQGDDFIKFGATMGATSLLYAFDSNIQKSFSTHKEDVPQVILDYGWYAGSPQNSYGATGAVYLFGLFTKNEKLRRTGVLLISSATATGFVQQLTKSLVGRARPSAELGSRFFKPFGGDARYRSFPSGHAVLTFTTAHTVAKQFKNPWVKAGIYTVGLIPGISRIYHDAHWASDVFLSWVMSYFVVEAIDIYLDRKYKSKYNDRAANKAQINLSFGAGGIGVSYNF